MDDEGYLVARATSKNLSDRAIWERDEHERNITALTPHLRRQDQGRPHHRTTLTSASAVRDPREFGRKVFPDHWSFMLGEVALYSFVILLLSGTFLTFFFEPSMAETHYQGSYAPLKDVEMSVAYSSSLDISFDVRGGLFMRQVHHWSALLFVASVVRAHAPGLLHRRIPQAARNELGGGRRAAHPLDGCRLHRLLAPR